LTTSAAAVAANLPNSSRQTIWRVPPDAFSRSNDYDFAVDVPQGMPLQVLIPFSLDGLGEYLSTSPKSLFE
jgi:hypothetical protein